MKVDNDTGQALGQGEGVLVLFPDKSAAFDTVDAAMLVDILHSHTGLEGAALQWFLVLHDDTYPQSQDRQWCFQWGSFASWSAPRLSARACHLSIYTQPLQEIFSRHGIWYRKYADSTTLYAIYDPDVTGDLQATRNRLIAWFKEVRAWLLTHHLQLNDCKAEFLCILSHYQQIKYMAGRPFSQVALLWHLPTQFGPWGLCWTHIWQWHRGWTVWLAAATTTSDNLAECGKKHLY